MKDFPKKAVPEQKTRLVSILTRGLIRCVDSAIKSSNIADIGMNKVSQTVHYSVDNSAPQSVYADHENPKH
jgi:hypothetical protein